MKAYSYEHFPFWIIYSNVTQSNPKMRFGRRKTISTPHIRRNKWTPLLQEQRNAARQRPALTATRIVQCLHPSRGKITCYLARWQPFVVYSAQRARYPTIYEMLSVLLQHGLIIMYVLARQSSDSGVIWAQIYYVGRVLIISWCNFDYNGSGCLNEKVGLGLGRVNLYETMY